MVAKYPPLNFNVPSTRSDKMVAGHHPLLAHHNPNPSCTIRPLRQLLRQVLESLGEDAISKSETVLAVKGNLWF